jgi:hypothetical protein
MESQVTKTDSCKECQRESAENEMRNYHSKKRNFQGQTAPKRQTGQEKKHLIRIDFGK